MRLFHFSLGLSVAIAAGSLTTIANAQNCGPATDVVLSDLSGEQVQPKVVDAADYATWNSWFDNSTGGYDVRLQRLDAQGQETFAHNGLLIADRSFSSTQDYDLAVDGGNSALLIFRDDRFGGTKVTAQLVKSTGSMPWGANGVQFGDGSAFVANPKITSTFEGNIVVGWINDSEIHLQRLDGAGNVLWPNDVIISDPNASLSLCDLEGSHVGGMQDDSVIVSWVSSASFNAPKHLYAQRIAANGSFQWGAGGVAVFDGGSLQFGNFPPLVADPFGGAVFAWYNTASPNLECLVQHIESDGTEYYPHNGIAVSTDASHDRVSPSAILDGTSNTIYVFWMEESNAQANRGVYGQAIDASGNRLWGSTGKVIRPLSGSTDYRSINASFSRKPMVSFIESAGFGNDKVRAAGLDAAGNLTWSPNVVDVTTGGLERSRLVAANHAAPGRIALVWQHGNPADIHTQTVRTATGTLGNVPIDLTVTGACPGLVRITARDATPGRSVAFVYATGAGNLRIPGGLPCHGLQLCLNTTTTLGANWTADGSGTASINVTIPSRACGSSILIQAIDLNRCSTSRAVRTP